MSTIVRIQPYDEARCARCDDPRTRLTSMSYVTFENWTLNGLYCQHCITWIQGMHPAQNTKGVEK